MSDTAPLVGPPLGARRVGRSNRRPVSPGPNRVLLLPVVLAAAASLVAAAWAGIARLGFGVGSAPVAMHAPLMILGFLGTVISVERAVGLGGRWPWAAPTLSAAGAVMLLAGRDVAGAAVLLAAGSVLVAVYTRALAIANFPGYLVIEALGAGAWVVAVTGLLAGTPVPRVVPALAAFLVLTILGERLELSRMAPVRFAARGPVLVAAAGALLASAVWSMWDGPGPRVAGVLIVAVALLSAVGDVARRTVRLPGVTGYMAWAILAGYGWLALAGLMWAAGALQPGAMRYDPALHALFVGFVLSMIFGHAPVIVPAVARIPLPFHPSWWVALGALHATLLVRVTGGLTGSHQMRAWGGVGNVVALGLFLVVALRSALTARRTTTSPTHPTLEERR